MTRLLALALLCALVGCQPPCEVLQLRVTDRPAGVVKVNATAQLGDKIATDVIPFTGDLSQLALRAPQGSVGTITVYLEGLDENDCVIARGQTEADLTQCGRDPASAPLRALSAPLCECSSDGWCREAPGPPNHDLNDVFALGQELWAVGKHGVTLRSLDGGATFTQIAAPGSPDLHGVWGNAKLGWWAVGKGSTVLRFDGAAWRPLASPQGTDWYAVWGLDDTLWIAGGGGAISRYTEGLGFAAPDAPGSRRFSGANAPLFGLFGLARDQIYAVGGSADPENYAWAPSILRFSGSGAWAEELPNNAFGGTLRRITGTSDGKLLAIGGCQTVPESSTGRCPDPSLALTSTGNRSWTRLALPPAVSKLPLRGASAGAPGEFWLVGGDPQQHRGLALRCQNGGAGCTSVPEADRLGSLRGVAVSGAATYAVGDFGDLALLSGAKAQRQAGPDTAHDSLVAFFAVSPTDAYAVGLTDATLRAASGALQQQGLILHWDGLRWTRLTLVTSPVHECAPGIPVCPLRAIYGDGQALWVAGEGGALLQVTPLPPGSTTLTLRWQGLGGAQILHDLYGTGGVFYAVGALGDTPVFVRSQDGGAFQPEPAPWLGTVLQNKASLRSVTGTAAGELWVGAGENFGNYQPHLFHRKSPQSPWDPTWTLPDVNGWPEALHSPEPGLVLVTGDYHTHSSGGLSRVAATANKLLLAESGIDAFNGLWGAARGEVWAAGGSWQGYRMFLDQSRGVIARYSGSKVEVLDSGTTHNLQAAGGAGLGNVWIVGDGGTLLRRRLVSASARGGATQ